MNKGELILLGAGGLGLVGVVAYLGQQQKSAPTFAQANPASVAAVQSGISAQIGQINDLAKTRMQTAADVIKALAGTQATLLLGTAASANNLEATKVTTSAELNSVGLQTSSAQAIAHDDAAARVTTAQIQSAGSLNLANVLAAANEELARINAPVAIAASQNQLAATNKQTDAAIAIAGKQADAQIVASNNQLQAANNATNAATHAADQQSHQQQQSSLWGSIIGGITSVFSHFSLPSIGTNLPPSAPVSYSPDIGNATSSPAFNFGLS